MNTNPSITHEEWEELYALKKVINFNPYSVHPDKMEKFTELYVKTLPKRDYGETLSDAIDS